MSTLQFLSTVLTDSDVQELKTALDMLIEFR